MIASIARIAEVPLDQVITAHQLQCQLPDQPPNVAAVILQHIQDIQPASLECLVIIDLELHAPHQPGVPPVVPHSTRQVHRVYPWLRRANILQLARVDAYCEWMRHSCLVYHNGRGWPILELAPRHIQHGAYFKVLVPPPPEGHGDTAHAIQVAREAADLFDFPAAGRIIPGLLRADNPGDEPAHVPADQHDLRMRTFTGLYQNKHGEDQEFDDFPVSERSRRPKIEDGPAQAPAEHFDIRMRKLAAPCQNKNGEEQEFDDFPVSARSRRPATFALPDVDWSGPWLQQLAQLMQVEGDQEVIDGPSYLYLQTWFIHHETHTYCRHPRPVRLTNEVISWSYDLRQT